MPSINVSQDHASILLYDVALPWVKSHTHLGHVINTDESTHHDILLRKGEFISKVHALRQEVGDQVPEVFMFLVQTYLACMYGSNLWDIFGVWGNKVFITWNSLIRNTFNLPYATHRYILYNICKTPHIRISLIKRFIKFYSRLEICQKPEVRHLFHKQKLDCRSVFGRNCFNICKEFKVNAPNKVNLSDISMPIKLEDSQRWRLPFLLDLLKLQNVDSDIPSGHLNDLINFICRD